MLRRARCDALGASRLALWISEPVGRIVRPLRHPVHPREGAAYPSSAWCEESGAVLLRSWCASHVLPEPGRAMRIGFQLTPDSKDRRGVALRVRIRLGAQISTRARRERRARRCSPAMHTRASSCFNSRPPREAGEAAPPTRAPARPAPVSTRARPERRARRGEVAGRRGARLVSTRARPERRARHLLILNPPALLDEFQLAPAPRGGRGLRRRARWCCAGRGFNSRPPREAGEAPAGGVASRRGDPVSTRARPERRARHRGAAGLDAVAGRVSTRARPERRARPGGAVGRVATDRVSTRARPERRARR